MTATATAADEPRYQVQPGVAPRRPWQVIDTATGSIVGNYATEVRAQAVAELANRGGKGRGR